MSNLENAVFELDETGTKLYVGSNDDGYYNWQLDISCLAPKEMKVVKKLIQMVKEQGAVGKWVP
jgi:hypothetical protein